MVGLAPGRGDGASLRPTLPVADHHRLALGGLEESRCPPEIQHLGLPTQHGGQDGRGAGQPAYLPGTERIRRSQLATSELAAQCLQRDRHDDGRGIASVHGEAARIASLQE